MRRRSGRGPDRARRGLPGRRDPAAHRAGVGDRQRLQHRAGGVSGDRPGRARAADRVHRLRRPHHPRRCRGVRPQAGAAGRGEHGLRPGDRRLARGRPASALGRSAVGHTVALRHHRARRPDLLRGRQLGRARPGHPGAGGRTRPGARGRPRHHRPHRRDRRAEPGDGQRRAGPAAGGRAYGPHRRGRLRPAQPAAGVRPAVRLRRHLRGRRGCRAQGARAARCGLAHGADLVEHDQRLPAGRRAGHADRDAVRGVRGLGPRHPRRPGPRRAGAHVPDRVRGARGRPGLVRRAGRLRRVPAHRQRAGHRGRRARRDLRPPRRPHRLPGPELAAGLHRRPAPPRARRQLRDDARYDPVGGTWSAATAQG